MGTFNDSETKVLGYINDIQDKEDAARADEEFKNSLKYKSRMIEEEKDKAKEYCLDQLFSKIYKDSIPLSDEYKQACADDIDASFDEFIRTRCPNGLEYYVKEAIKKNSPFAKKVLEAVDELVKNEYHDKEMDMENIDYKELVFNSSDDLQKKLDIIGKDLSTEEISQAVQDNVKATALSEITRAKKEKEELENLEKQLASDVNMNTTAAVENALELNNMKEVKDYEPSLFQGVMINKLQSIQPKYESGELSEIHLYGALEDYGRSSVAESGEIIFATPEELAFVEAVKEYSGLSLMKALKMESFTKEFVKDLALEYAHF